ncbi:MAG: hypothetical protein QOH66_695 [Actinomycetota bacterium]|nr:hypothetical protein [Actinomycetota bacterium]
MSADDARPTTTTAPVLSRPDLDAAGLLEVWEEGWGQSPPRRALGLLEAAWPGAPPAQWLATSMGRRDACLLTLHEELFGGELDVVAACPGCGEPLEVSLHSDDLRMEAAGDGTIDVEVSGYRVRGRVPTSADLLAILGTVPEAAYPALLCRCIDVAQRGGAAVGAGALPEVVTRAVAEAMARTDPQADVQLAFRCPACDRAWSAPFDIASYVWDEVDDWAQRLVRDVHALAGAYGWTERDILAMSARRRRLYLELCGAS